VLTLTSPVYSAGWAHGANGAPTPAYNWVFDSQNSCTFVNPVNASSMRVRRLVVCNNVPEACTFHCEITDNQGNTAHAAAVSASFEGDNTS
jgi:hypothetical protein